MTISNTTVRGLLQGDASTVTFAIPFDFSENTEVNVYLRDESDSDNISETLQVLTTDYSISSTNVVFVLAPAATDKILIERANTIEQPTDLNNAGTFDVETIEARFDAIVKLIQEVDLKVQRSIKYKQSTPAANLDDELPEPIASKFLARNSLNSAWELTDAIADTTSLAAHIPEVIGSRAAPKEIVAANGLNELTAARWFTIYFVAGSGGPVDITAADQIEDGDQIGQMLTVIGTDSTNYVLLENGNNLLLNGAIQLDEDVAIIFIWDGSNWTEISRSN